MTRHEALAMAMMVDQEQLWQLAVEYDRLTGSDICGKVSPIEKAIDDATGKTERDQCAFFEFVVDAIQRMEVAAE